MIREEEIKYASKDYVNYLLDKQEYHNENYAEDDIRQAFEKGAQWADDNPKSPWISVEEDLPCNHKELLNPDGKRDTLYVVAIIHGYIIMSRMYKLNGKWYWENDKPTHWFPIPERPKNRR